LTLYIQSVATKHRCTIHEKWKRENRYNGNQKESKKEEQQKALRTCFKKATTGTR
jgi:hypothetical protein